MNNVLSKHLQTETSLKIEHETNPLYFELCSLSWASRQIVKLFEIGCFEIKKFSFLYLIINEMDDNFHLFYLRNVNLFISSHQPATPSFLHQ
jgi:hypothetical protein